MERLIAKLDLRQLPREGGWFRQTWTATPAVAGDRSAGTAIYFLITPEDFSAFHRLATDEVWHFYAGDPVELVELDPKTRTKRRVQLGADVLGDAVPQHVVRQGIWQGARLAPGVEPVRGWALLGCTLAPGWDEADFILGNRTELLGQFPEAQVEITLLTR
ncbi:MAG: cupin domain-containing protein [Akkermansiaceae bacterium]|nr:cupin domain-containing protein [Akkermansiaceae bacterium]